MNIRLHKQARTTPAIRKEIQESTLSERALAEKYNISRATVHKWKHRAEVEDYSNRPHDIHAALSPQEEMVVVFLRATLLLPLDDLLMVAHVLLHLNISRSALDRCLRRHGVSSLNTLVPRSEQHKREANGPGYLYIASVDLNPHLMAKKKRCLYIAVDHASRWVHCAFKPPHSATDFLKKLLRSAPFAISTVHSLSTELSEDPADGITLQTASNHHPLALLCRQRNITLQVSQAQCVLRSMQEEAGGRFPRWSIRQAKTLIEESCHFFNYNISLKVLGNHTPMQIIGRCQATSPAPQMEPSLRSPEDEELFLLREKNRHLRLEQELLHREVANTVTGSPHP